MALSASFYDTVVENGALLTFLPTDNKAIAFDFTAYLGAGDTLDTATPAVFTPSVVIGVGSGAITSGAPSFEAPLALQRITGCVAGLTYLVTCVAVTTNGDTLTMWANIQCVAEGCTC